MRNATSKDKMEFAFLMAKHSTATLHQLQRLLRYGATHGRLMTDQCNRELTTAETKKLHHTRLEINSLCHEFKATAVFQGDPRGCTVKIAVPDG